MNPSRTRNEVGTISRKNKTRSLEGALEYEQEELQIKINPASE